MKIDPKLIIEDQRHSFLTLWRFAAMLEDKDEIVLSVTVVYKDHDTKEVTPLGGLEDFLASVLQPGEKPGDGFNYKTVKIANHILKDSLSSGIALSVQTGEPISLVLGYGDDKAVTIPIVLLDYALHVKSGLVRNFHGPMMYTFADSVAILKEHVEIGDYFVLSTAINDDLETAKDIFASGTMH